MYITKAEYEQYAGAFDGTEQEFDRLAEKASDIIDAATSHMVPNRGGLDGFVPFVKTQVTKAAAAQIEHMVAMGGWQAIVEDQAGDLDNVRLGSFSYGAGNKHSGGGLSSMLSGVARGYLAPTGLMYRGVGVRG